MNTIKGSAGIGATPLPVIETSADGTHYVWKDQFAQEHPVSDFVMEPVATIKVNGDEAQTIFVVRVEAFGHPEVEEHQVSAALFHAVPVFKKWCQVRRLSWNGDTKQLNSLFTRLNMAVVPELVGVTVTGLHGNAFVQENNVFGYDTEKYAYVKPVNYVERKSAIRARSADLGWTLEVEPGLWGRDHSRIDLPRDVVDLAVPEWRQGLWNLARLHRPDVMTPILGWMAAAPLRSLFTMFPPLAVMGGAGWGKSTIIRTVMDSFGYGTDALGLNGTTPYAIFSMASSTNALPVWFEEYRLGVRQDAKDAVNQLLRDAWEAGAAVRGGTTENLSRVMAVRVACPVVVTGEDTFSETSHLQRILLLNMPKDGKNEPALAAIEAPGELYLSIIGALQEFFSLYVEWLLFLKKEDLLPEMPNVHDRQAHGRAVARYGYSLLQEFVAEMGLRDLVLPAWDESRVASAQSEHVDLYEELIDEAVGVLDADGRPVVWDSNDGYRNIRPGAFVAWVKKNRTEDLAGGRRAVTEYVKEKFGALEHDYRSGFLRKCWRWPVETRAQADPSAA
jgi:hypothetical protein